MISIYLKVAKPVNVGVANLKVANSVNVGIAINGLGVPTKAIISWMMWLLRLSRTNLFIPYNGGGR